MLFRDYPLRLNLIKKTLYSKLCIIKFQDMKNQKRHSLFILLITLVTIACEGTGDNLEKKNKEDTRAMEREMMVKTQIEARGVENPLVLEAMRKVERHQFVSEQYVSYAYIDDPLPIGEGQTISQPYIVAFMTELLHIDKNTSRVLEIGTGSGYQSAILAEITKEVYTIEIIPALAETAEKTLKKLGYKNIFVRCGDGYQGWREYAPFDAIIITAAPPKIPEPLLEQLKIGGRMVLPLGDAYQELIIVIKTKSGFTKETSIPVRFVPMTGEVRKK